MTGLGHRNKTQLFESGTQEIRKKYSQESEKMSEQIKHRELTEKIIAAAIAVHRELGPGFLESIYEEALYIELDLMKIPYERQIPVSIPYRGKIIGEHRLDLFVAKTVVVELKATKALEDIYFAIVRSYMKAVSTDCGLLFNFAAMPLTIKRVGREVRS
jgi:GxxExxY protein